MRLFKTTYTVGGKVQICKTWYFEIKDHRGIKRTFAGDKSRDVSAAFAKNIEKLVHCRKLDDRPDEKLAQWFKRECPDKLREKLIAIGIFLPEETVALTGYLEQYKLKLEVGFKPKIKAPNTLGHVKKTHGRVKQIIDGCGFSLWSDINFESVHKYLTGLKCGEKGSSG